MARKLKQVSFRVRFVYDEDSCFEECNGESRPLTEAEYAENAYQGCPDHPRTCSGANAPDVDGVGLCAQCGKRYETIPYAEYLAYYGNPERHVYLGCVVDKRCGCCGNWDTNVAAVWGIDMMDDQIDVIAVGEALTPAEALALPGYLAEVAGEELHEAGYTA